MTREHPEATDPLRQRLPRPNAVRLLGHCKSPVERSIYGYIEALEAIAREALAAGPEPEWEYWVVYVNADGREEDRIEVPKHLIAASRRLSADDLAEGITATYVQRRTPRAEPGEWEALPDDSERTP